jgi:putative pyruvate formate lyase activating enzyme
VNAEQVDFFRSQLEACLLCPRRCGVDRLRGATGACGAAADLKVAASSVHTGEEPPISGRTGSGTIFFAHCNMACVYCQNFPISQLGYGNPTGIEDLAGMMLDLESRGASNINLVTPTHFLPRIVEAISVARHRGLMLPIVYNSSGYELAETVRMLEGIVQIYLADMRYATSEPAARYSNAPDYPAHNRAAISEMLARVGHLRLRRGVAESGLIVRHLVLPSLALETQKVLEYVANHISRATAVSLMSQYFPANRAHLYPELARKITPAEYDAAVSLLERYGLENGWIQDPNLPGSPVA